MNYVTDANKISYNHCGVCSYTPKTNTDEPNRAPISWWDADDGWKVGTLCRQCYGDTYLVGPKPGDYAFDKRGNIPDINTDEDVTDAVMDIPYTADDQQDDEIEYYCIGSRTDSAWRNGNYDIKLAVNGKVETKRVMGVINGVLGITKNTRLNSSGYGLYQITHIPSGWLVQQSLSFGKCKTAVERVVASNTDFNNEQLGNDQRAILGKLVFGDDNG